MSDNYTLASERINRAVADIQRVASEAPEQLDTVLEVASHAALAASVHAALAQVDAIRELTEAVRELRR